MVNIARAMREDAEMKTAEQCGQMQTDTTVFLFHAQKMSTALVIQFSLHT